MVAPKNNNQTLLAVGAAVGVGVLAAGVMLYRRSKSKAEDPVGEVTGDEKPANSVKFDSAVETRKNSTTTEDVKKEPLQKSSRVATDTQTKKTADTKNVDTKAVEKDISSSPEGEVVDPSKMTKKQADVAIEKNYKQGFNFFKEYQNSENSSDLENAETYFSKALEIVETHPDSSSNFVRKMKKVLLYNRGATLMKSRNRLDDAIKDFTAALATDKNYYKALKKRGEIYAMFEDPDSKRNAIRDLTAACIVTKFQDEGIVTKCDEFIEAFAKKMGAEYMLSQQDVIPTLPNKHKINRIFESFVIAFGGRKNENGTTVFDCEDLDVEALTATVQKWNSSKNANEELEALEDVSQDGMVVKQNVFSAFVSLAKIKINEQEYTAAFDHYRSATTMYKELDEDDHESFETANLCGCLEAFSVHGFFEHLVDRNQIALELYTKAIDIVKKYRDTDLGNELSIVFDDNMKALLVHVLARRGDLHAEMGDLLRASNQPGEAFYELSKQDFSLALTIDPNHCDVYHMRARGTYKRAMPQQQMSQPVAPDQKLLKQAKRDIEMAFELGANTQASAHQDKCMMLITNGQDEKGLKILERAQREFPNNPDLFALHGELLMHKNSMHAGANDISRAIEKIDKAIKLDKNKQCADAYLNKGLLTSPMVLASMNIQMTQEDFNEKLISSAQLVQTAVEIDPTHKVAWMHLTQMHLMRKDIPEVIRCCDSWLKCASSNMNDAVECLKTKIAAQTNDALMKMGYDPFSCSAEAQALLERRMQRQQQEQMAQG